MPATLFEAFHNPGKEYSAVPFWFLNGPMDKVRLRKQLCDFRDHGVYGVIVHPRMGFDPSVAYLSDAYLDWMAYIVDTARELDMFVFLYDEGMYPSGSACGQVVAEDPEYAARALTLCVGESDHGQVIARIAAPEADVYIPSQARLLRPSERPKPGETLYSVVLDYSHGTIRGLLPTQDDGLPDAPPAADLLDENAVRCFIRLTHERYYARMPEAFGTTIRAMFTDEPSPTGRCVPQGMLAWTRGMDAEWIAAGHKLTELPALFMDAGKITEEIRTAHEELVQERLLRVYYQPLRNWCESHDIALTGHPAKADCIGLEHAFTIPGQDLVWRWVAPGETAIEGPESTQAHCAADSMLHNSKTRCLDECFGCCGPDGSQWGMTVADMRWMLDYLFVRGVNMIAPHAFFYHMDPAISAQDRPPDVGPSNYWWPHFRQVADYISRMSAITAIGEDLARIAVLSDSLHLPWHLTAELQRSQLPFHYVEFSDLCKATVKNGRLIVAEHEYTVLITPELSGCKNKQLLLRLKELVDHGMYLLSPDLGGCVSIQNVVQELISQDYSPAMLTPACEDVRVSHRKYGEQHVLMLFNEGLKPWEGGVRLPMYGSCELWDAWSGTITPLPSPTSWCRLHLEARQSVLLVMQKHGAPHAPAVTMQPGIVHDLSALFSLELPGGRTLEISVLRNWQTIPDLADFSGTLTYRAVFPMDKRPLRAILSLGDVREICEVTVNGHALPPMLLPPFVADVAPCLVPGMNTLEVKVTSALVTRYEGKPWPCGLLGPVTLTEMVRGKKN